MRWTAVLAGLLLVTAGCLGSEDDGGGVPPADDGSGAGASTSFATETYEGEITGATVPMGGAAQGDSQASFQVPNGARVLYLNVTTEGGELDMQYGPDCQTDPAVSCSNNATTSDGGLDLRIAQPTTGAWDAFFFIAEDTVAGEVSWTLDVTVGVVTEG